VSTTIAHSEAEFEAGRVEFDSRPLVAAREHFDRAVEILMLQPQGARGETRLQAAYERLLDRVTALEVLAFKDADGITESRSEPAAIDEVLKRGHVSSGPHPKRPRPKTVAIDLEQMPSDVPIAQNAKVLSYIELIRDGCAISCRPASIVASATCR
jgi:hypothetical protein